MYNLGHPSGTMHGAWHLQMNTSYLQHRLCRRTSGPVDAPLSGVTRGSCARGREFFVAPRAKNFPKIFYIPRAPPSCFLTENLLKFAKFSQILLFFLYKIFS